MSLEKLLNTACGEYNTQIVDRAEINLAAMSTYYLFQYDDIITPEKISKRFTKYSGKLHIRILHYFRDECITLLLVGFMRNNPISLKKIKMLDFDNYRRRCKLCHIKAKYYRNLLTRLELRRAEFNMILLVEEGKLDIPYDEQHKTLREYITNKITKNIRTDYENIIKQKSRQDNEKFVFMCSKLQDLKDENSMMVQEIKLMKSQISDLQNVIQESHNSIVSESAHNTVSVQTNDI